MKICKLVRHHAKIGLLFLLMFSCINTYNCLANEPYLKTSGVMYLRSFFPVNPQMMGKLDAYKQFSVKVETKDNIYTHFTEPYFYYHDERLGFNVKVPIFCSAPGYLSNGIFFSSPGYEYQISVTLSNDDGNSPEQLLQRALSFEGDIHINTMGAYKDGYMAAFRTNNQITKRRETCLIYGEIGNGKVLVLRIRYPEFDYIKSNEVYDYFRYANRELLGRK